MTQCECKYPGYCKRHKMLKSPHLWELCRTREDYFQAWEGGHGPGQRTKEGKAPVVITVPCSQDEIERRRTICLGCDCWMNDRCELIELGCRPAFYKILADAEQQCPEGKW